MTSTLARRRRRDRLIAAAIALVVAAGGALIYLTSDARATSLTLGPDVPPPAPMTETPTALQQVWELPTDPRFPGVASPYGTVVTADEHTVTGHDPVSGAVRWSYGRSNLPLCAVGGGDTDAAGLTLSGAVRGIVTGYVKSGRCSEITLLNPITGDRRYQRTGFTGQDSTLVFGSSYGGMVSADLVELWRYDLVRTIQYGNQPEPTKPNTKHLGCEFADVAVAGTQFATIEHCSAGVAADASATSGSSAGTPSGAAATELSTESPSGVLTDGPTTRLVLNYDDPGATADGKSKNWDALNFDPRATVELPAASARLLGVSAEEALVLVAAPEPTAITFDATGAETGRVAIEMDAAAIAAADASRVTPVRFADGFRYVLVGSTLIGVSADLAVTWTMADALGLPAVVGDFLLVPVAGGLAVVGRTSGVMERLIPVDRAGYAGRVDAATVGLTVVENRGGTVIGLRDPAAPATDQPVETTTRARPTNRLPGLDGSSTEPTG